MPKVWNPTEEKVETRIFGNHFEFSPGQMKNMKPEFADFVSTNRKETGLVVLPGPFDPMNEEEYREGFDKTPEGKAILEQKKEEGIRNLVEHLRWKVYNNQVSLKRDLAHHDPSNDPKRLAAIEASPGELEAMRTLAKYQRKKMDGAEKKAAEIEKLLEDVGPTN